MTQESQQILNDPDALSKQIEDEHRQQLLKDHYSLDSLNKHCIQFNTDANDEQILAREKVLEFDCDFESGNIGTVEAIGNNNNEFIVSIRGDTMSPRHSVWFYFRVKGGISGNKFVCHIHNCLKGNPKQNQYGQDYHHHTLTFTCRS